MARWHLLPESYLMGMVDIRAFAKNFKTFILGNWYPHGIWWYFPVAISIKTTLGLIGLVRLAGFAMVTPSWTRGRITHASSRLRAICLGCIFVYGRDQRIEYRRAPRAASYMR